MDLGIALPQWGPHASPQAISRVAREAEQLGYASLWVQERLLRPVNPVTGYGGVPGWAWPEPYKTVYDPIETLTYVAAQTQRIKLGTSVLDAPYHPPIVMAKRLASLDQFSSGRLIVGLGQGWSSEEFEAVDVSPKRRGAGFEEWIAALRAAWQPDPVSFAGRFYRLTESEVGPKPVQAGGPPILLASFAQASFERAARLGLGLNPILFDWAVFEGIVRGFRAAAQAAGRDPASLPIVVRANNSFSATPMEGQRPPLSGSAGQIREDLDRVARLGIDHVFFDLVFAGASIDDQVRFLRELRPA